MRRSAPMSGDPDPTSFPFPVPRYPDVSWRWGGPDDLLPGRRRRFPHEHRSRGTSGQHRKQTQKQHDHQDFTFHGWSASRPATGPVMMCDRHKRRSVSAAPRHPRWVPWLPGVLTASTYLQGQQPPFVHPPLVMVPLRCTHPTAHPE